MSTMELNRIAQDGPSSGRREKNQNIQVFVRVRPMNGQEINKHTSEIVDTPGTKEVVVRERSVANITKTFTFDKVFGPNSKQTDVYKAVVAPLLQEVLLGYNCTVFAYGQTGTGKTFTMEGDYSPKQGDSVVSIEKNPGAGILPRALSQVFDDVRMMNCEYSVRVSFLELYNEELYDLLSPIDDKTKTLRLFEDTHRKGSVIISGLEEVIVHNKHEVYTVLERGTQQRKTAATLMNASSSRSHTVFTITLHMKESSVEGEEMLKVGKLHLVDLAGSENIGKSGAVDKRAREAGQINQSLLTLGRVISALVERTPHVPYRESKLTRLLQDSLGRKTKTSIIATVSPSSMNIEETLSTLDYAHRAKNIMNKPEVNQRLTKKEALNIYTEEIERLRRDLNAKREKNGIFMDMDNYNRTTTQLQNQIEELNDKSNRIRELEEAALKRDAELDETYALIDEQKLTIEVKNKILEETRNAKATLEEKLSLTEDRCEELQFLVQTHVDNETKLAGEAGTLITANSQTVAIIDALHARIDRKTNLADKNWQNGERFRQDFRLSINEIFEAVSNMRSTQAIYTSDIRSIIKLRVDERQKLRDVFHGLTECLGANLSKSDEEIRRISSEMLAMTEKRLEDDDVLITDKFNTKRLYKIEAKNSIVASIHSLRESFGSLKGDLTKLKKEIALKFDSMQDEILATLTCDLESFEEMDENLKETQSRMNLLSAELKEYIDRVETRQQYFKDDHEHKLWKLQTEIQELLSDTGNYVSKCTTDASEVKKKVVNYFVEYDDSCLRQTKNLKAAIDIPRTAISGLAQHREHNVIFHQKKMVNMFEKIRETTEASKNFEQLVINVHDSQDASLENLLTTVKDCTSACVTDINGFRSELEDRVANRAADLHVVRQELTKTINSFFHSEEKVLSYVTERSDSHCDDTAESCSHICSSLQQSAGSVDEFWDATYLVDHPTGVTPLRRKYEYPTKLTITSPHDRVVERYRKMKNNLQSAIDECDRTSDDEASCTSSSNDGEMLKSSTFENENGENTAPKRKRNSASNLRTIPEKDEGVPACNAPKTANGLVTADRGNQGGAGKKVSEKVQQSVTKKTKRKSGGKKGILKVPI